jgi:hypothetical protein
LRRRIHVADPDYLTTIHRADPISLVFKIG